MVHLKRLVKATFLCSSEDSSKLARVLINESLLKMDPCNFRRNKPPENGDFGALRCASSWDWCRERAAFKVAGQGFCSTELTARLSRSKEQGGARSWMMRFIQRQQLQNNRVEGLSHRIQTALCFLRRLITFVGIPTRGWAPSIGRGGPGW